MNPCGPNDVGHEPFRMLALQVQLDKAAGGPFRHGFLEGRGIRRGVNLHGQHVRPLLQHLRRDGQFLQSPHPQRIDVFADQVLVLIPVPRFAVVLEIDLQGINLRRASGALLPEGMWHRPISRPLTYTITPPR